MVLKDPKIKESDKEKIRKVILYKNYFIQYWGRGDSKIYERTTFLEQDAVTYLVVASPFDKIEAKKECFPFVGCFPYLGFFKKEGAEKYAKELNEKNYVTFIRPVYAYSSLGHFTDPILSSFFYFKDEDLAELVFHELFHTIFFIKDEVELNENMANYFAEKMRDEYFKIDPIELARRREQQDIKIGLKKIIVDNVHLLDKRYLQEKPASVTKAEKILKDFLEQNFFPRIKSYCHLHKISLSKCGPLKTHWNNASFAAYLTYERKSNFLATLHKKRGEDLKEYFHFIKKSFEDYQKAAGHGTFSEYLQKEGKAL